EIAALVEHLDGELQILNVPVHQWALRSSWLWEAPASRRHWTVNRGRPQHLGLPAQVVCHKVRHPGGARLARLNGNGRSDGAAKTTMPKWQESIRSVVGRPANHREPEPAAWSMDFPR